MVRKRVNKIKKESGTDDDNSPVKIKQEIKSEDLEDVEDNKIDLKLLKKDIKSKKSSKVNNLRYFNKSGKLKRKDAGKKERGVVYVKCLPHGFYEKQLEGYFGQFGKVTGVYVPKARKTGRAKGYGFVEFLHPEVAEIAADTMNNYLMFNRLIKTEVVPPEKQRSIMFSNKYKMMKAQRSPSKLRERAAERHKLICTKSVNFVKEAATKVKNFHKSLKTLGVDYKFKIVGAMDPVKLTGMKAIDPDKSSPKGKTTSPLIKSPTKKKINKKNQNSAEPHSSGIQDKKFNKLEMIRKRVNKIKKVKIVDKSSSIKVKQEIKSEDVSSEGSPAKKKKKTIKNKQNKKPPTEPQSSISQDKKVNKLEMIRKRVTKVKKESSVNVESSPVKVKQEIKVKNIKKKKNNDMEDNKNNLKKDFKSKKTPKVNNLRSQPGKLKSKIASKKLA